MRFRRSIPVGLIFTCAAFDQLDAGQISAFVRDATGAVVPAASVTATNEGNHEQHRMTTSPEGYYVFPQLFVGKYSVAVEAAGFKKSTTTGITLDAQAKVNVDVSPTVAAISEAVETHRSSAQVQTTPA